MKMTCVALYILTVLTCDKIAFSFIQCHGYKIRNKYGSLFKWYLTLDLTFHKLANPYIITDPPVYFHSRPILLYMRELLEHLQNQLKRFLKKLTSMSKMDLAGPFNNSSASL